jgi:hypothetical protein
MLMMANELRVCNVILVAQGPSYKLTTLVHPIALNRQILDDY